MADLLAGCWQLFIIVDAAAAAYWMYVLRPARYPSRNRKPPAVSVAHTPLDERVLRSVKIGKSCTTIFPSEPLRGWRDSILSFFIRWKPRQRRMALRHAT